MISEVKDMKSHVFYALGKIPNIKKNFEVSFSNSILTIFQEKNNGKVLG